MADQRYILRVFVASPADVSNERDELEEEIRIWNSANSKDIGVQLELVRWETDAYPDVGEDAQDVINRQIDDQYDIFVGILWGRYGTPTARADSGTEEEFIRAKELYDIEPDKMKIMIYFKDEPIAPSEIDPEQLSKINKFKKRLGDEGVLWWPFNNVQHFGKLVRTHLTRQVHAWRANCAGSQYDGANVDRDDKRTSKEISVEDDEELGLFDYIEKYDERFDSVHEASERTSGIISKLGSEIGARTAELESLPTDQFGNADWKYTKPIVAKLASNMSAFVTRVRPEIDIFKSSFAEGLEALTGAIEIQLEMVSDGEKKHTVTATLGSITELELSLNGVKESITGMKDSVETLPRLTGDLNRAKRQVVRILGSLLIEYDTATSLLGETKVNLNEMLK